MQTFQELVKHNSSFTWYNTLNQLFINSKDIIIHKCQEGIHTFDPKRHTCLQTDCDCTLEHMPTCCPKDWRLVFAGSRFTSVAETQDSPTEGEILAVTQALDKSKLFVLGCKNLSIVTDHKPLLDILNNRGLSSLNNSRLCTLKEKTFHYQFTVNHCPRNWHRGADAVSRNPTQATPNVLNVLTISSHSSDVIDEIAVAYSIDNIVIALYEIQKSIKHDQSYITLVTTVKNGFPNIRNEISESIKSY